MKQLLLTLASFLLTSSLSIQGQVFSVSLQGGNKLFFSVTDTTANHVEVIQAGSMVNLPLALPSGVLEIPSSVTYKEKTYQVTAIAKGAFSSAEELTFVSIPSSVKSIGDRAFAGCSGLTGVVFPASEPELGNKIFDGCTALRSVSLGSDWKSVDLNLFASSEALGTLYIPAKVVKITNLKALKPLARIDVDGNNPTFSSFDGVLYSKDGKALYACPGVRTGKLVVPEGVERIQEGAFNECSGLTAITLPSTLHSFSYLDFATCTALTELTLFSEVPPMTAKWNGASVFAVRVPGPACKVYVPGKSLAAYQTAVCDKAGEYGTPSGKKENSTGEGLLTKKGIARVKASR